MSLLNRSVLVAAVVVAGAAFAQPANDTCAGAEIVTPGSSPGQVVLSSAANVLNAAAGIEAPLSCLFTPTNGTHSVWFSITPAISGQYRIESCAAAAAGTTITDTVIAVYTGSCGTLTPLTNGCNDDGCTSQSFVTVPLTAGTQYWVQLAKYGTTAPSAAASAGLQIAVTTFASHPNDLCSATSPQLTLNRVTSATTAAIDAGYAPAADDARLDGGVGACFAGIGQTTSTAAGRDVPYVFRALAAGSYSIRAHYNSTPNTVLYLTNTCLPSGGVYGQAECVAASNRNSSAAEQISCLPMTANQEVYVWLDESTASTSGAAVPLEVSACFRESEPNDTPAQASALSCVTTGSIADAGEPDFFALGAPPAGSRVFALVEGAAANLNNFDLRVTTGTSVLEYDDSNAAVAFGTDSALVAGTPLNGAPAYLRVNYSTSSLAEPYVLYSKVQTGAPTAEIEPNNTIATATGGAMYFEGSIQDGGNDVDFFSFTANEGDVIFAALDSVPDRADAGTTASFNFSFALVDSAGATLVAADDGSTTVNLATNYDAGLTHNLPSVPGGALVYRARSTGTYGIRVGKTSGTTLTHYGLSISVGCSNVGPSLTSFTPTAGVPTGGEVITLTGANFSEQSVVKFGANVARVISISPTQLVVNAPASALGGEVPVTVTNGIGLTATAPGGYTYEDPAGIPPTLLSVSPSSGPSAGGATITLNGSIFRADAGVFFDVAGVTHPAASVTRSSTTRLLAVTPPHSEGLAVVIVSNPDGLSTQLDGGYTFLGAPTIASVTPSTGLTTGGQAITITGTN
ncbi:MAG: IPT/TIG domain-containing protein, partial [Archangium sp.]